MRHGSLFSGIGGFDLAAEWAGFENVFQVEIDKYCQKVLQKNFPGVKRYGDIKEFDGQEYRRTIDVISGGFPCQKYSHAGKREGNEPLAKEMLRIIREIQPSYILAENVYGFFSIDNGKSLNTFCSDLENCGYEKPVILDFASDFTGVQTMERHLWIITKTISQRWERSKTDKSEDNRNEGKFSRTNTRVYYGRDISKTRFCRVGERVSGKLDVHQRDRLQALGNAIVPQVAYRILKTIKLAEEL